MNATGIGIIGYGFMGRRHARAYLESNLAGFPNKLVALCDANLESIKEEPVFTTSDPEELIAHADVGLISICTPTPTHVDLALRALASGKHVLVEKPIALSVQDAQRLANASNTARTLCMPAMCMRFWPGWTELASAVRSREFGEVLSASFQRLSAPPNWSPDFYSDTAACGGALFDLHVHDADFVQYLFGAPIKVTSTGSLDHVNTTYEFGDGPRTVTAEGGWNLQPGEDFVMRYQVEFERGSLDFDLSREAPLVLKRNGQSEPIAVADGEGYDGEVRHLLQAIAEGATQLEPTVSESVQLIRILQAERRSLEECRTVPL